MVSGGVAPPIIAVAAAERHDDVLDALDLQDLLLDLDQEVADLDRRVVAARDDRDRAELGLGRREGLGAGRVGHVGGKDRDDDAEADASVMSRMVQQARQRAHVDAGQRP